MRHTILRAETPHGIHLILHQCNQWRYDDRHAFHHEGRQLIAHGFSTARWHNDKRVIARQDGLNY